MSDVKTIKPQEDENMRQSETMKCIPADGIELIPSTDDKKVVTSEIKDQDVPASGESVPMTLNENADESAKETKPESEIKIITANGSTAGNDSINESSANDIKKVEILTNEENKESLQISQVQPLESTGAGDACLPVKCNENGTVKANIDSGTEKIEETTRVAPITDQTSLVSKDKTLIGNAPETDTNELTILKLKKTVQKITDERDACLKKLGTTEKKLASLQTTYDALMKGGGDEAVLHRMVEELRSKLVQTSLQLEDRIRIAANQEKQISALNNQVASLKEVETLTRSLLQIRNMEVKHLQTEVDDMEVRINEERERYNTTINKMDAAVKLNADLKKEYETQLRLFRDLREKYEEKVTLLSQEKQALENSAQAVAK